MSNSIGNNFLHQSLLSPTVLEHQGRINSSSCAGGNTLFQPHPNSLTHKSCISTAFRGNRLRIQKNKLLMGKQRAVSRWPQAVLAADASAEVAVHSGADLESAVANCMGYKDEGEGFMVGVHINPISGLPSGFQELIRYVLLHIEDKNVEALLETLPDSTVRTTVERGYEELSNASPEGWNLALSMLKNGNDHWALFAKSVLDRTRLALASKAESYHQLMQPSAVGRSSAVEAIGYVVVVDELLSVQNKSYSKPTILVAKSVKGEEEIPDGAVAVLTPDMPDVLSHVSVRARNSKVGAKSRNIAHLKGKVPSWVNIPTSVALPFGVFETVLSDDLNQVVADNLQILKRKLDEGDFSALGEIRSTVLELSAPPQLVVMGLGETLVGAYPGRALSFICKKNDLDAHQCPMDEEEKVIVDYSSDPLIVDGNFRRSILSSIARAGSAIEDLYGSAQDIEGVVKDGKIYVVQTRPQM
ncbi:UNVERIFIED_CONTAM: Alpha-glucan water dikinase, chloroplastic [Sesamum radiatum]|uniref:Alpha-glucan water dikinase, chloroplastic n=1 Tax=Sesamum radiatum TaxID=300843 RepID=A0AAW2JSY7_SESRA